MPNRIIREGIISSDRMEQLDPPAEVFYRRLLNKVDDHGLYDARASILRSSLYPLRLDRVKEADCVRWVTACVKAGLIRLYEVGGKPYLKVLDTRWQVRSEPKYPLPTTDINGAQVPAVEHLVVDVVVDGDVDGPAKQKALKQQAVEVLTFLNERASRDYRPVDANISLIEARLKEGATVEDCKAVVDRKCSEWMGGEMDKYLRPATLFNATKFAQYQGEKTHSKPSVDL